MISTPQDTIQLFQEAFELVCPSLWF